MGSGHFLVALVDYLADQVIITAMAEAEASVTWGHYVSPLSNRIEAMRDLGYVDRSGRVKPPFKWNWDRRRYLRAKLDAM